jgi:hypothetical protein
MTCAAWPCLAALLTLVKLYALIFRQQIDILINLLVFL